MTLRSTTNVHGVVSVKIQPVRFSNWTATNFQFTLADGSTIEVDAFSAETLDLVTLPERPATPVAGAMKEAA